MLNTEIIWFNEILKSTKLVSEFNLFELVILIIVIGFISISVFYFIPFIQIKIKLRKIKKEAANRKKLLNQIITQKEIEEEIEEEIKKLNLKD